MLSVYVFSLGKSFMLTLSMMVEIASDDMETIYQ